MKLWKLLNLVIFSIIMFFTSVIVCRVKDLKNYDDLITIPLDLSIQRPVLELMINGSGPYKFIFDTGSSGNVIDKELADSLKLKVIGEDPMQTPQSNNKVMSKRVKVPNITFKDIDISEDATMNTLAIRKMLPVDGVLSAGFFSKYLITIDYADSKLILTTNELNKTDKDVIPFIQDQRVISIDIFVDGNKIGAHLDSGNPGRFAIPFSLKDKLNFKEEPTEAGVINTPAASFKKWEATLVGDIKIGSLIYKNPDIILVEGFQFVNLGYQLFKDLIITIDKKNNLIKFEKAASLNEKKKEEYQTKDDNYNGWYGGHQRKIFIENGEMYLQRGNAPKLKLVKIKDDEYEMVLNMPVRNELPNVRFERNKTNKVVGLTFVYKDGRKNFVEKDQ